MPNLKSYSLFKKSPVKVFSAGTYGIRKLLRLSDSLANCSFCVSDISTVQLKSN